jgi:hypothetical protein
LCWSANYNANIYPSPLQEKLVQDGENTLEELTFANLGAFERSYLHRAAQDRVK